MTEQASNIIALCGYPGSGKTSMAKIYEERGYFTISGSGLLRELLDRKGYVADGSRDGLMDLWREHANLNGRDWMAKSVIEAASGGLAVFDGLRILEDAYTLREAGAKIVYMHSTANQVLERLARRARSDDGSLDSIAAIIKRQEIEDSGTEFRLSDIRDMCDVSLLPVPNINDEAERNIYLGKVADSI